MKKIQILIIGLLFFGSVAYGQYSETFSVPNKGIITGPCTGSVGTTCLSNDFAGVNWTIEGNLSGIDSEPFATTNAGVLEVNDIDEEACWVSPVLDIIGASASFSVDLTWLGYDEDSGDGSDYIDIEYKVDGGSWTQIPNQVGGGTRTIEYTSGGGTNNPSYPSANSYGASGITGSTLQIRVCIDHNSSTSETTTLDNVTATGADVPGAGPTCDIAITGITVGGLDCPATDDGSLTITATTTNGPILYQITGPVSQSNATGIFTNLPTGSYTITVDDGSFTAGTCTDTDTRTITAGVDNTDPTASNPAPITVDCPADIPAPDVSVVIDEDDSCTIPCPTDPWINEFHYDNNSTDVGEFVEVAGPAGIDLSNYTIYTYDGSDRMVDQIRALSGIIDNESNGFGAVVEYISNLQNTMEGIALVRNPSTVVEFLSYEGSFIALDGPAAGLTSTNVGVSESESQATNESLSRIGTGNKGTEFTFADQLATAGSLNGNQTMVPCPENAPVVTHFSDSNNGGAGTSSSPYIVTRTYRVTDAAGNFIDVTQTLTANNCGPANDACVDAIALNCGDTYNGTFDGATNTDTPTECAAPNQEAGLWFSFTGTGQVVALATNVPAAYNSRLNVYSGSCGNLSCVTGDEDPTGQGGLLTFCSAPGVTYYIFVGTDATSPTGSFSISVICSANPPPSITCPTNITTNNDVGVCGAAVNFTVNTSDNCGPPTLTEANNYASGDVFPVGTTTLNWTATDVGGATASCSFEITVNDNEAPVATCQNVTANLDANGDFALTTNFVFTQVVTSRSDNCQLSGTVGVGGDINYDCADVGDIPITFGIKDVNGNDTPCSIILTIADPLMVCNEPPTAICKNITVQADGNCQGIAVAADFDDGSSDPDLDIITLSVNPSGPYPLGLTNVVLTVSDGDLSSTCNATITVEDNDLPTIDCSNLTPNVTRNTRTGFCDYVVQGTEFDPADFSCNVTSILVDYTATDNLDGAIFPVGTTPVTWTVSNSENETASCTFNVIIEDNEAPNAVCQNITVQLSSIGGATISASDINNGSNDACGIASLSASPTSFNCGAEGDNTVTLTVTDVNGNSSTCTSTVTVEDNVAPTANCQNVTVELDNNGDGTLSANDVDDNSFDACSIGSLSVSPNTFDCDDVGANTVTLTVTDIFGNSSTCTATATVEDNIAPVVVCQDVTVQLDPVTGTTPANPFTTGALVSRTDNCALAGGIAANGPNPITCAQVGSYNQTIFVDDVNGNTTPCTVEITVQDITAPSAVCKNITVQLDGSGNATISGSDIDGGSTDACGIASLSASPNTFDCNDIGINNSTLTVTDNSGNPSTCTASVTVQDNVAPTAVCQDFTLNLDNAGTTTLDPVNIDGGSSTACGTYSLSVSPNGFDCDDLGGGPYTVTLTVTDDSNGQTDNCTANITVADPNSFCCDPPAAVCQNITVQLDANGNGSITASDVDGGSTADCGLQSLTATPTTFDCNDVGNNTVTLTITDIKNQSDNCTATVTVEDNVAPTALCQNVTVQLDASGNASTSATAVDNGSNDACGIASLSASPTTFDCDDSGANTVTLTVTDNNGNSSTCTATVTVEDNIAPNAVCQNTTVQLDASGNGSIVPADVDGGSTDNCTFILTSLDNNAFDCSDVGANTVVLTISDFSGNSNTCNATVTVEDNVAPTALCQNVTVQLDNNGNGSITAADVDNGSNDACGITSLAVAPTAFDCDDIGPNTVTLTVTDNNGNSSTCTATATVEDNVPPSITECEGNFAVFNGQEEILAASVIDFAATDACGLASTTYSPEYISCEDLGSNVPVTVVVTDNNGNPSTCIAIVKTDGLPCGFMDFEDDGIGCVDGNEVSYDVPSETFTVESDGCATNNFAQDDAAYVKAELCGNGEIIAHVTSISPFGQGWAGITMRESEAPGAKKVELLVNLGNFIRRSIRTTTNGYAYPAQFFRPGATWLKLVRTGNLFIGYASIDGVTWQNVLVASVPMNTCIQAGLTVTNYTNTTVVTATFDNVEVNGSGGMNLEIPDAGAQTPDVDQDLTLDFSIFPNPVSSELQVDLSTMAGKAAEINIYNQMGQQVMNTRIEEAGYLPEKLDMSSLSAGVYLVEVICGEHRLMKKLMKSDR